MVELSLSDKYLFMLRNSLFDTSINPSVLYSIYNHFAGKKISRPKIKRTTSSTIKYPKKKKKEIKDHSTNETNCEIRPNNSSKHTTANGLLKGSLKSPPQGPSLLERRGGNMPIHYLRGKGKHNDTH